MIKNALLEGIDEDDLPQLLKCLQAKEQEVARGEAVLLCGEPVERMGIVLSGALRIEQSDRFGNVSLLASLAPGELFGEAFACAGLSVLPVSVLAQEDSRVLLLRAEGLLHACPQPCASHQKLILNLMHILARKNVTQMRKIELLSRRTTREKLRAYFSMRADEAGNVQLPFSRQELADYLCVERSAMSAEMGRMAKAGEIAVDGRRIRILPS